MSENTCWLIVVGVVAILIVAMVLICSQYDYMTKRMAMENGYQQSTIQGREGVYWIKSGRVLNEKVEVMK